MLPGILRQRLLIAQVAKCTYTRRPVVEFFSEKFNNRPSCIDPLGSIAAQRIFRAMIYSSPLGWQA